MRSEPAPAVPAVPAAPAVVDLGTAALPGPELHEMLGALREESRLAGVRFHGVDARLVTRYADVREVFRDDDALPAGATYRFHTEPVVGRTFISMDGHEHDVHRKLATPLFRSRAVERFEADDLVPLAHEVVDRFVGRGEADLVREFTTVLPFLAITRKLGVPPAAEDQMRRWADRMLSFPVDPDGALAAAAEFSTELRPLLEERRARPGDDVLSGLAEPTASGTTFDDDEVFSTVRLLFSVGATTTAHAMGNLLSTLLDRPALLARVRAEPPLRTAAVHELLRWEGPLGVLPRIAPFDAEVAGEPVAAGTMLLLGLSCANRDPREVDDPDSFDVDRTPGEVLTFGFGRKFCPGSHLARRELLVSLGVLLDRLPGLRLVDRDGAAPTGAVLRRPDALHVAWDAAAV